MADKSEINQTRITPACAGKSFDHRIRVHNARDHPRVCGEKKLEMSDVTVAQGSPPRVRGKVTCWHSWLKDGGITPACAGKR